MDIENKKARKFGFIVALTFVIGSFIGIGVFFKNGGISNAVDGQSISWLSAWILGGLVSLFGAISFSDISKLKVGKITGITSWAQQLGNKKFGYFVGFNWSFFYWGIWTTVLGVFASEVFWTFISLLGVDISWIQIYHHIIFGFIISWFYIFISYLSPMIANYTSIITVALKIIPLIIAIVVGIVFFNNNDTNAVPTASNAFETNPGFSLDKVILASPGVLFAYDGFVSIGTMRKKMKNNGKQLPLVIMSGITIVAIFYTLIAIASILHNTGSVENLIKASLSNSSSWVAPFTYFFIFISTIGLINGNCAFTLNDFDNAVDVGLIFGSSYLKKRILSNHKNADFARKTRAVILIFLVNIFWSFFVFVPSLIYKTDDFVDGASNWPTVFFFNIYALIMIFYLYQKIWGKLKPVDIKKVTKKYWIYIFVTIIAILLIMVIEFGLLYKYFYDGIINSFASNPWEGFFSNPGYYNPNNIVQLSFYLFFLFLFLTLPYLNLFLIKKVERREIINKLHELSFG
ncbi:amino acid transporter [Mycoplasma testudineum]|uniref:Amino acid transporter n=1 Tax=Mycoplasma testudineum TaxID=244584 RepID=A0A4R6IFL5_9MOLU|nr:amino acid transporter [Mycoplasma testudineum]